MLNNTFRIKSIERALQVLYVVYCRLGADINKADDYSRTPLHVATSADYPEMVRFLIDNGADIHVTTEGELQTPLHFAARNEASECVKVLLAYGATLEVRDYKQRTPLQVQVFCFLSGMNKKAFPDEFLPVSLFGNF